VFTGIGVGSGYVGVLAVTAGNLHSHVNPVLMTVGTYNNSLIKASHADSSIWNNSLAYVVRYWTFTYGDGHVTHRQESL